MKESLHLTNATSSLSIAWRITGASRSHSHQKIAIQMHARTVNNMRCMWSSGSLHNAAIPPIDLTPCAAKLTEADEARYGCVCIINTLTSVNTLTRNLLLRQLNKSCRHHIIAMMNSWTDGCSPVSIITIRTKNRQQQSQSKNHPSFFIAPKCILARCWYQPANDPVHMLVPKTSTVGDKWTVNIYKAWHLNQSTILTYTSVLVSMQIVAHAATWKRTTLQLVQQANVLSDPEVVGMSLLFLIWSPQGSAITV